MATNNSEELAKLKEALKVLIEGLVINHVIKSPVTEEKILKKFRKAGISLGTGCDITGHDWIYPPHYQPDKPTVCKNCSEFKFIKRPR